MKLEWLSHSGDSLLDWLWPFILFVYHSDLALYLRAPHDIRNRINFTKKKRVLASIDILVYLWSPPPQGTPEHYEIWSTWNSKSVRTWLLTFFFVSKFLFTLYFLLAVCVLLFIVFALWCMRMMFFVYTWEKPTLRPSIRPSYDYYPSRTRLLMAVDILT